MPDRSRNSDDPGPARPAERERPSAPPATQHLGDGRAAHGRTWPTAPARLAPGMPGLAAALRTHLTPAADPAPDPGLDSGDTDPDLAPDPATAATGGPAPSADRPGPTDPPLDVRRLMDLLMDLLADELADDYRRAYGTSGW